MAQSKHCVAASPLYLPIGQLEQELDDELAVILPLAHAVQSC